MQDVYNRWWNRKNNIRRRYAWLDKSSNVKISLDNAISDGKIKNVNLKTFDIVSENGMSDSDRNSQILDAIKHLMGAKSE